jgi:hypothetical protein
MYSVHGRRTKNQPSRFPRHCISYIPSFCLPQQPPLRRFPTPAAVCPCLVLRLRTKSSNFPTCPPHPPPSLTEYHPSYLSPGRGSERNALFPPSSLQSGFRLTLERLQTIHTHTSPHTFTPTTQLRAFPSTRRTSGQPRTLLRRAHQRCGGTTRPSLPPTRQSPSSRARASLSIRRTASCAERGGASEFFSNFLFFRNPKTTTASTIGGTHIVVWCVSHLETKNRITIQYSIPFRPWLASTSQPTSSPLDKPERLRSCERPALSYTARPKSPASRPLSLYFPLFNATTGRDCQHRCTTCV